MIRLVAAACLLVAATAFAAGPDTPLGIAHYEAGKRLYDQGRYPQALIEFSAGYELTRRPAFLINIAQCHRQMHEPAEAIAYYRQYLAYDSTSKDAAAIERVIAELQTQLPPAATTSAPPELRPPPAPVPTGRRHVLTWIGVGVTGALVVAGGALEIAAKLRFDGDVAACARSVAGCTQGEHDSFVLENRAAGGVLIAAGVVGIATIVAAIVESRRARR
jgi:tetratricopeptide (TPR) repeat protein